MSFPGCSRTRRHQQPSGPGSRQRRHAGRQSHQRKTSVIWRRFRLRPRYLRDVSQVDTRTTVQGQEISAPICISPTGFHCLAWPDGEMSTARGVNPPPARAPFSGPNVCRRSPPGGGGSGGPRTCLEQGLRDSSLVGIEDGGERHASCCVCTAASPKAEETSVLHSRERSGCDSAHIPTSHPTEEGVGPSDPYVCGKRGARRGPRGAPPSTLHRTTS